MSPTLFYNALFLSSAVVFFNGVTALPAVVTVTSGGSSSSAAAASMPSTTIAASIVASSTPSSSSSAAASTSTVVSPLGSATDVFTQGKACKASWIPASSSSTGWKNMTIDLMTGSNLQMTKLATVASGLDGTSSTSTSYAYSCPDVTPNAPIYFLQYTHDGGLDPTWTTRFTIANDAGIWMPPTEANQPEGGSPAVPWGQGELVVSSSSSSSKPASAQMKTSAHTSASNSNTSSTTSSLSVDNGSLSSFQRPALSAVAIAIMVACLL